MFNKFFEKFKTSQEDESITENIDIKDTLIVELADTYISYKLNDNSKIEIVQLPIEQYDSYNDMLKLWVEAINVILETFKVKPCITLLIKSSKFLVKLSDKHLDEKSKIRYFANKLALSEENIEVKPLTDKSYFIVEYKFLQQILFMFKDYKINNIYDLSILNSLQLKLKEEHLYLDISLSNCDVVLNHTQIQKRSLKTDLQSFIQTCSKSLYVDFETSYQNIKINFKDINNYEQLEESTKPLDKNLQKFIDDLIDDIKNTLSYFSVYDDIKYIDTIYINGDILEFDFIIKILSQRLDINIIAINKYAKINNFNKTNITLFDTTDSKILITV